MNTATPSVADRRDAIRDRHPRHSRRFPPDGTAGDAELAFLDDGQQHLLRRIRERTYANMAAMLGRSIPAVESNQRLRGGDPAKDMPEGYRFVAGAASFARAMTGKPAWALLGIALHVDTLIHVRDGRDMAANNGPRGDSFLVGREWAREDDGMGAEERDRAVGAFVDLLAALYGIVKRQAEADGSYFIDVCGSRLDETRRTAVRAAVLDAYRWQHIVAGLQAPRFVGALSALTTPAQRDRIGEALADLMQ